jgi:hypothetical protein
VSTLEELAPMYVGAEALALSVDPNATLQAFTAIDISVDYSGADPLGVRLPLELLITSPSPTNFRRRQFLRSAPDVISFTPQEGGRFLVVLREVGHNRLLGKLSLVVEGDRAQPPFEDT